MSEIKWIKLSVNMFDDEKIKLIRSMPEGNSILVIWIQLLSLAGKTNDTGMIYIARNMAYSEEMLATIFDHPLNVVRLALDTLAAFDLIEVNPEGVINITNWEKHQNVEGMERVRKLNNARVRKHREKKAQEALNEPINEVKQNVTLHETLRNSTDLDLDKDLDKDKDKELLQEEEKLPAAAPDDNKLNAHNFYQNNFGMESPTVIETIENWISDLGEELVIEAMRKAALDQKSFSYAIGIMRQWINKNIKTLEDVKAEEVAFQNRRMAKTNNNFGKVVKNEQLPDWATKEQQKEEKPIDDETAEKFNERLKRFRKGTEQDQTR